MKKVLFEKFIKKYSVNGHIDSVKWVIDKATKTIHTKGCHNNRVLSYVTMTNFDELDSMEIGVTDPKTFKSMLSVLGDDITLAYNKTDDGKVTSLSISDTKNEVQYALADTLVIPKVRNRATTLPPFEAEIKIDDAFVSAFSKATTALKEKTLKDHHAFTVLMKRNKLCIVIGNSDVNTNRISINVETIDGKNTVPREINFDAEIFKDVLASNNEGPYNSVLKISQLGVASIDFVTPEFSANYFLMEMKTNL